MNKIRIGIIGAGKMAVWHAKSYARIPGVEIAAIANPASDRGRRLAAAYGAAHFSDGFKLIESGVLNAVDICVPTGLHKEYILAALDRGLHVYCEKPLAAGIKEVEEVIAANRIARKIIFNGFNYRFIPEFIILKDMILSGKLGAVRYVRMSRFTKDRPDSYMMGPQACGIFHEFHCHFADLLLSFGFGMPRRVFASGTNVYDWPLKPDTATTALFYTDGRVCEITTSNAVPGLAPDVLIAGTEGAARLQFGRVSFIRTRDAWPLADSIRLMCKEALVLPHRVLKNPFSGSCRHFVACLRESRMSECDESAALHAIKITTAAEKSFREQKPVEII